MKRAILLAILLISACTTSEADTPRATIPPLSPIITPTHTPFPDYVATTKAKYPNFQTHNSPTQTPSPTQFSPNSFAEMLAYFPLAVGMQRTYQVTVQFFTGFDEQNNRFLTDTWRGLVIERITDSNQEGGELLFRVEYENYPGHNTLSGPEIISKGSEYRLTANSLFLDHLEILQWPLTPGRAWAFDPQLVEPGSSWYMWTIQDKGDVSVQAGNFSGCIQVSLWTQADHTVNVFCPGAGLVRQEYAHHGGGDDIRLWELVEISMT